MLENDNDQEETQSTESTQESEEQTSTEELYEIVVDGKTQNLTLEELKSQAQKGADYTQKTQELAENRKKMGEIGEMLENDPLIADDIIDLFRDGNISGEGEEEEEEEEESETPLETEKPEGNQEEISPELLLAAEKELQIETKEIKEKANQLGVEIEEGKIAQYAYEKDISLTQAFHTLYFDAVAESSKNKGQADLLALLDSVDSEQKPNGKQIIDMPESPSDLSWEEINRRGAKYLDENTT